MNPLKRTFNYQSCRSGGAVNSVVGATRIIPTVMDMCVTDCQRTAAADGEVSDAGATVYRCRHRTGSLASVVEFFSVTADAKPEVAVPGDRLAVLEPANHKRRSLSAVGVRQAIELNGH